MAVVRGSLTPHVIVKRAFGRPTVGNSGGVGDPRRTKTDVSQGGETWGFWKESLGSYENFALLIDTDRNPTIFAVAVLKPWQDAVY